MAGGVAGLIGFDTRFSTSTLAWAWTCSCAKHKTFSRCVQSTLRRNCRCVSPARFDAIHVYVPASLILMFVKCRRRPFDDNYRNDLPRFLYREMV